MTATNHVVSTAGHVDEKTDIFRQGASGRNVGYRRQTEAAEVRADLHVGGSDRTIDRGQLGPGSKVEIDGNLRWQRRAQDRTLVVADASVYGHRGARALPIADSRRIRRRCRSENGCESTQVAHHVEKFTGGEAGLHIPQCHAGEQRGMLWRWTGKGRPSLLVGGDGEPAGEGNDQTPIREIVPFAGEVGEIHEGKARARFHAGDPSKTRPECFY